MRMKINIRIFSCKFYNSLEFIKMETDEPPEPLLSNTEIANKIATGEFILRENKKKGKVWSVFAKIYNQNDELVYGFVCCKVCGRLLTFNGTNSTSNLVKHRCYVMKCIYKIETQKQENSNSSFENNTNEPQKPTHSGSILEHKVADNILTNLFTKCFIKRCRSYQLLQDEDFKAIFQELIAFGAKFGTNIDIDKVIPDTTAVAKNVSEIYGNCFTRVFNEITAAKENGFGLACHMWTEEYLKKDYFILTIHFFCAGKIASRLLGLRPMEDEKCSNQNISQNLNNILGNYDCELSNSSLIVISGCNYIMDAQTIPCFSTLLSEALIKSMDEIPEVSQLISSCMKLHRLLMEKQMATKLEKYTSSSHWLSIYKVLDLVTNSWNEVDRTAESRSKAQIENINKDHLKALMKILRPFKDAIESLQDDNNATLYLVLVYLHNLKKSCEDTDCCKQYTFIKDIKRLLRQYLEKIGSENVTTFHKVALFLYPPAKKLLQFDDIEKKNIEAECIRLMQQFEVDIKRNIEQEAEVAYAAPSKRKSLFTDFVSADTEKNSIELIEEELQIYKLTRVKDCENFDLFSWWEEQQQHFPHLYKLSHMVLSTPATSVAAQRIFSSVRNLLCDEMPEFCLNDKDKERIAFVKFNSELGEFDSRV